MADSKLLGCLGVVIGLAASVVLGWMTLELLLSLFGASGPVAALTDPVFQHELGELLVVGMAIISVYVLVFRESMIPSFVNWARYPFWLGATLNLVAWMRLAGGTRWSVWMLLLFAIGICTPWVLSRR